MNLAIANHGRLTTAHSVLNPSARRAVAVKTLTAKQEAGLTPTHFVLAGLGLSLLSFALAFWRTKLDDADDGAALAARFSLSALAIIGFVVGSVSIVAGVAGY